MKMQVKGKDKEKGIIELMLKKYKQMISEISPIVGSQKIQNLLKEEKIEFKKIIIAYD